LGSEQGIILSILWIYRAHRVREALVLSMEQIIGRITIRW